MVHPKVRIAFVLAVLTRVSAQTPPSPPPSPPPPSPPPLSPATMQSVAVQFRLSFDGSTSRRQLQTEGAFNAFAQRLSAALVAALPSGISSRNLLIEPTNEASGSGNTVTITIVDIAALSATVSITQIVTRVGHSDFTQAVGETLGVTVSLEQSPAVIVRETAAPSPPPTTPPPTTPPSTPPPSFPPASPLSAGIGASIGTSALTSVSGALTSEMLWVIILGTMGFVVCLGCAIAYCCGVRHTREREQNMVAVVGRPALRHKPSTSGSHSNNASHDHSEMDATSAAAAASPLPDRQMDTYMIELGMRLERSRLSSSEAVPDSRI